MNQFKSKLIPPSETDSYPLANDGGLIYNPISREKLSHGTNILDYGKADVISETIESGGVKLSFTVPKKIVSYDAVPIRYTLEMNGEKKPVYVEATSDEDCGRSTPHEYDLVLPGSVDIEYEYLGYTAGYACPETRPVLRSDFNDTVSSKFPNYNLSPLTPSVEVEKCDITWFKFRYKNIGNTVLSGDGNGTFCFSPELYKKENGEYILYAIPENIFYRVIDRVYPGESGELYVTFCNYPGYKLPSISLEEGEYKIVMRGIVRNENTTPERYERIIWSGDVYSSSEMEFTVKKGAGIKDAVIRKAPSAMPRRDRWLHTYEEFRTSYDAYLSDDPMKKESAEAVLYLQCAPWDNFITIKLMLGDGDTLVSKRIPIENNSECVKVRFNPDNKNYVILPDGTRFPAITAQSMVDMRCNVQQGPDPAGNIIGTLLDMKKTGINLINSTAAFEFDSTCGKGVNNNIDAFWFSVDVMRHLSLTLEGYITYPYMSRGNIAKAEWINKAAMDKFKETGAGEDEVLSYANAVKSAYQFNRWGDIYWLGGDGSVVLSLEDTRGWMRIDYNAREPMSAEQKKVFIEYVRELYGSISELNTAWGSDYTVFEEIDPEVGAAVDHGYFSFKDKSHIFGEWGRAISDLDEFRTLYRVKNYREMIEKCAEMMPNIRVDMRTEGANYTSAVDPETKNTHLRHVYYSQRRNAMIPELLYGTDTLYAHSDYVTLPYTPSEVRYLTRSSVENGIIPMHMPQFNRMRDIAVNEKWGNDFSFEYNTCGKTSKGAYINTVCSVFEWFRETYENGGLPGILWQDYLCDGYATETQRREIRFFADKLTAALDCEEGRRWMNDTDGKTVEVRKRSYAKHTYDDGVVDKLIEKKKRESENK